MASDRRVLFLITAAGSSQRFVDAGYYTPKHELMISTSQGTRRMIEHVLQTLPSIQKEVVIGVSRKAVLKGAVCVIVENSSGPADTVYQTLSRVNYDGPVITMDCDTLILQSDIERLHISLEEYNASVLVYEDDDRNMSRIDRYPHPTVFVEKSRISEWGIVSARGFDSAAKLREVALEIVNESRFTSSEPSMANVLNRYPGKKRAIEIAEWTDWGTPARIIKSGARIDND